jgi:hypothetical protein
MPRIQEGRVRDLETRYREIVDEGGNLMATFNSKKFPNAEHDARVYFISFNIDPMKCENVQLRFDVHRFRDMAAPNGAFGPGAELYLQVYIMAVLLAALDKQGRSREKYLDRLADKMASLCAAANDRGEPLTVEILEDMCT